MKWDEFIARKGGMKNTLTPLKISSDKTDPSSYSGTIYTEFNRPSKLDAIPAGKREEQSLQASTYYQQERSQSPIQDQQEQEQSQSPIEDQQEQQSKSPRFVHEEHINERPQSPTPEQQQQRKADDEQHVQKEEAKDKNLLKGKPIIFVGGGPGMINIKKENIIIIYILILKVVVKEHNVKK